MHISWFRPGRPVHPEGRRDLFGIVQELDEKDRTVTVKWEDASRLEVLSLDDVERAYPRDAGMKPRNPELSEKIGKALKALDLEPERILSLHIEEGKVTVVENLAKVPSDLPDDIFYRKKVDDQIKHAHTATYTLE